MYLKNHEYAPQNRRAAHNGWSPIDPQTDGPVNAPRMALRATAAEVVQRQIFPDREVVHASVYHYNDNFELSNVRCEPKVAGKPTVHGANEASGTLAAGLSTPPPAIYVDRDIGVRDYMDIDNFPLVPSGSSKALLGKNGKTSEPTPGTRSSNRRKKKYTWDHDNLKSVPGQMMEYNVILDLEQRPKLKETRDPVGTINRRCEKEKKLQPKRHEKHGKNIKMNQQAAIVEVPRDILQLAIEALKTMDINPTKSASTALAKFFGGGDEDDNKVEEESYRRFLRTGAGDLTPHSGFDAEVVRGMLKHFGFIHSRLYDGEASIPVEFSEPISLPPLPPKRPDAEARAKAIFKRMEFDEAENQASFTGVEDTTATPVLQPTPLGLRSNFEASPPSPQSPAETQVPTLKSMSSDPNSEEFVESSSSSRRPPPQPQLPTPETMSSTLETEELRQPIPRLAKKKLKIAGTNNDVPKDTAQNSIRTEARRDPHTPPPENDSLPLKASKKRSFEESSDEADDSSDSDSDDTPPKQPKSSKKRSLHESQDQTQESSSNDSKSLDEGDIPPLKKEKRTLNDITSLSQIRLIVKKPPRIPKIRLLLNRRSPPRARLSLNPQDHPDASQAGPESQVVEENRLRKYI